MASPGTDQPAAEQRKILRLVFQLVGVADIALGLAVAVWGPGFVGGDPLVEKVIWMCGAALALGGLAMIWFARRRFGGDRAGGSAGLVVRPRRYPSLSAYRVCANLRPRAQKESKRGMSRGRIKAAVNLLGIERFLLTARNRM